MKKIMRLALNCFHNLPTRGVLCGPPDNVRRAVKKTKASPKRMKTKMRKKKLRMFFVKMIHVPLQDPSSDASIPDAILVGTPGTLVVLGVVIFIHP